MKKIKLRESEYSQYPQLEAELNKGFAQVEPVQVGLDLGRYFTDNPGVLPIRFMPYASANNWNKGDDSTPDWTYATMDFDLRPDRSSANRLAEMVRSGKGLNSKAKKLALEKTKSSNEDLLRSFTDYYLDVVYSLDKNRIYVDHLYSKHLRKQGLQTGFFNRLGSVIDFKDLNEIRFGGIVEDNSDKLFKKLEKNVGDEDYFQRILRKNWIKNPFIRILKTAGFKDISLVSDHEAFHSITGSNANELKFLQKYEIDKGDYLLEQMSRKQCDKFLEGPYINAQKFLAWHYPESLERINQNLAKFLEGKDWKFVE